MIKKIPLILSIALIGCSFTACGNDDSSSSDSSNEAAKNTSVHEEIDNNIHGNDSNNAVEEIITDAGDVVGDIVDEGENIISDAGDSLTDMTDASNDTSATEN